MKLIFISLVLMLGAVLSTTGDDFDDSLTLRIFNQRKHIPKSEMRRILLAANLKSHGFKLEISRQVKTISGRTKKIETHFYYKIVPCDKARDVEKELNALLKGALGEGAERKLKQDLSKEKITSGKMCKTGLEVHYNNKPRLSKRFLDIRINIRINLRMSTVSRVAIVRREYV